MQKSTHSRNGKSEYNLYADYKNVKQALTDATEDVKGRMGEIFNQSVDEVKDRSQDLKERLAEYVAEKPFKSLGWAVFAGFLLSRFLRRK
jgi:ElaB/YqjD/DUF883 family membrane-anchored ribosome-binding protein